MCSFIASLPCLESLELSIMINRLDNDAACRILRAFLLQRSGPESDESAGMAEGDGGFVWDQHTNKREKRGERERERTQKVKEVEGEWWWDHEQSDTKEEGDE